ncbi:hypothetical protein JXB01_02065, partial [Candidatus Micrarchaeota archaeon]|nr:hypothetical protein [Candidatus Micrarchaeota archaeon]
MDDEEQQRLLYEAELSRQQLGMIKNEIEKITLTIIDLTNASKTVEGLSKSSSLVPIGGNSFIEADVVSEKVLVPIGGGYILRMEKESAKQEL